MSIRQAPMFMRHLTPPPCFTKQQWDDWRKASAHKLIHHIPPQSICEDCTPTHKQQMLAEGRCTHPESTFVHRGGALIGVLPTTTHQEEPTPCTH